MSEGRLCSKAASAARILAALFCLLLPCVSHGGERVLCLRVVDGDTFLSREVGKVRLLGVDTPELDRNGKGDQPGAREAAQFLKEAIEGKVVLLDYDLTRRDKYGRTLAYVTDPQGRVVNEEILRRRLGVPIRFFSYRKKAEYMKIYEDSAR